MTGHTLFVDRLHHLGVETQARVEQKPTVIGVPETDSAPRPAGEQIHELAGGLERIGIDTQRPGENVCAASRHHRHGRRGQAARLSGSGRIDDPVDHLVHAAVAAVDHNDVVTLEPSLRRQFAGMATVGGVFDGDVDKWGPVVPGPAQ